VAGELGDRVKHWITFNEPPVIIGLGHQEGKFAPGLKLPFSDCLLGAHHLLMAHGRGVQALRAGCAGPVAVSIAHTSRERIPATNAGRDIEAARRDYFACTERTLANLSPGRIRSCSDNTRPTAWSLLRPIFRSSRRRTCSSLPRKPTSSLTIAILVGRCALMPRVNPNKSRGAWGIGNPRGSLPWLAVAPDAAYWSARFQTERYGLPFVFSENGYCQTDFVQLDGRVHDPQRIDFMTRYLRAVRRAVDEGVPVTGYFYWSMMDNFEWAEGYKDRFGLVHVDFEYADTHAERFLSLVSRTYPLLRGRSCDRERCFSCGRQRISLTSAPRSARVSTSGVCPVPSPRPLSGACYPCKCWLYSFSPFWICNRCPWSPPLGNFATPRCDRLGVRQLCRVACILICGASG